jgi:hypothetical protein
VDIITVKPLFLFQVGKSFLSLVRETAVVKKREVAAGVCRQKWGESQVSHITSNKHKPYVSVNPYNGPYPGNQSGKPAQAHLETGSSSSFCKAYSSHEESAYSFSRGCLHLHKQFISLSL